MSYLYHINENLRHAIGNHVGFVLMEKDPIWSCSWTNKLTQDCIMSWTEQSFFSWYVKFEKKGIEKLKLGFGAGGRGKGCALGWALVKRGGENWNKKKIKKIYFPTKTSDAMDTGQTSSSEYCCWSKVTVTTVNILLCKYTW